jgi:HSP20 family protein
MLTRHRNSSSNPQRYAQALFLDWETPWRALGSLRQDLDRLFGAYERSIPTPYVNNEESVDIHDAGNEIVITLDLPGVSKKDVELSISGDNVFVKASRNVDVPAGYTSHRRERASYTFENAWKLPVPVQSQNAEASLKDGVLTIRLPKSPNAQPKQIPVKTG